MSNLTQPEGIITGMAAKMFVIAGPVIVFGTLASVVYGVVLMLMGPRFSLAPRRTIFYNSVIESNNGGWHDVRKR